MENNERFSFLSYQWGYGRIPKGENTIGINVRLLDTENIENNSFWVINQLVVKENNNEKTI